MLDELAGEAGMEVLMLAECGASTVVMVFAAKTRNQDG